MIWLVEAAFLGHGGSYDPEEQPPASRATLLNATVVHNVGTVEFKVRAAVEGGTEEEAIAETRPVLTWLSRQKGATELVSIDATEYETKADLAAAL